MTPAISTACHLITFVVSFAVASSTLTSLGNTVEPAELKRDDLARRFLENDTVLLPCDNHCTYYVVFNICRVYLWLYSTNEGCCMFYVVFQGALDLSEKIFMREIYHEVLNFLPLENMFGINFKFFPAEVTTHNTRSRTI